MGTWVHIIIDSATEILAPGKVHEVYENCKVRREEQGRQLAQKIRESDSVRGCLFFFSPFICRRPNLGLFGPNTAPHLREKGVECSLMSSPICFGHRKTKLLSSYIKEFI